MLAWLVLFSSGGCGSGNDSRLSLGLNRQWLLDSGLSSLLIETYAPEDQNGVPLDCDRLAASFDSTAEFTSIGAPQVLPLTGEGSVSSEIGELPPGLIFILVVGYGSEDATGPGIAVGCGESVIRPGEKVQTTIAMRTL